MYLLLSNLPVAARWLTDETQMAAKQKGPAWQTPDMVEF